MVLTVWESACRSLSVAIIPRNVAMTDRIGAPGTGISRREFLIASGTGGAAALAGCVGSAPNPQLGAKPANLQQKNETLPLTAPPQVVQVNEQGGESVS